MGKYKIGELKILIQGESKLKKELCHYLRHSADDAWEGRPDLRINVSEGDVLRKQSYYSLSGKFGFSEKEAQKKDSKFNYTIENLFSEDEETVLNIYFKHKDSISQKLSRSFTGFQIGLNSFEEQCVDSIMTYAFFWYILPVVLLKSKMAFIHSSVNVYNKKGFMIIGTSGCGKTSLSFKLLEEEKCKFVSDDFGIVDSEGKAFYNPKYIAIYESDISYGQRDLVNLKKNMKFGNKIHWKYAQIRKRNPRIRISAEDLLGKDRVVKECKIENVFYFTRSKEKEVSIKQISVYEMARRATKASFRELSFLYELIMNAGAVCEENMPIPTIQELLQKQEERLKEVFSHTNNYLVSVPFKAGPDEVLKIIGSIIE